MFSFGTGLSYKLSKVIHIMILQMFKGLFTAFSLSFMRFTLNLYICCSELSASSVAYIYVARNYRPVSVSPYPRI